VSYADARRIGRSVLIYAREAYAAA